MISPPVSTVRAGQDVEQPTRDDAALSADVQTPSLQTVLQNIRQDSLALPLSYLDEVNVPFGGE